MNIGRFEVVRQIGKGGMGVVLLAHDPRFDRHVAIKLLGAQYVSDESSLARFHREARAIARLEHAAIVPVYDFGEEDGQPYLVMRYMAGGSLASNFPARVVPPADVVRVLAPIADALDFAHRSNVIHRDVKPANVLFDSNGEACLSDFGIARMLDESTVTTSLGISGTARYMSPEQARGESVTSASDVYSLAVVLFELLAGKPPFDAENAMGVMFQHVNNAPPSARLFNPSLSARADAELRRSLDKSPGNRHPTARALIDGLSGTHAEAHPIAVPEATLYVPPPAPPVPVAVRHAPPPQPEGPRFGKFGWLSLGLLVGGVAVAGGAYAIWNQSTEEPEPESTTTVTAAATSPPQTATSPPTPTEPAATATAPGVAPVSLTGQWNISDNVTAGTDTGLTFAMLADVVESGAAV